MHDDYDIIYSYILVVFKWRFKKINSDCERATATIGAIKYCIW